MKTRNDQSPALPNFDALCRLARDDPQGYEALRQDLIERFIDAVPEAKKRRLRGLQFRIDMERRLAHSALGAVVRVYELMWKSFLNLNDNWQDLLQPNAKVAALRPAIAGKPCLPGQPARIIAFRPLRDRS